MQEKLPLLGQVRRIIRLKHHSIRTEDAYVQFIKRFILFQRKTPLSPIDAEVLQAPFQTSLG